MGSEGRRGQRADGGIVTPAKAVAGYAATIAVVGRLGYAHLFRHALHCPNCSTLMALEMRMRLLWCLISVIVLPLLVGCGLERGSVEAPSAAETNQPARPDPGQSERSSVPIYRASYGEWHQYELTLASGRRICYIAAAPTRRTGGAARWKAAALVTRIVDTRRDEFSIQPALPGSKRVDLRVTIGDQAYDLFGNGSNYWPDPNDDPSILAQMDQQPTMTVHGTSDGREVFVDTYSLDGFLRAWDALDLGCRTR